MNTADFINETKSSRQKEIEMSLYDFWHKFYLSAREVGVYIGITTMTSYMKWLSDVPYTTINGRKKYGIDQIAEKLYNSERR